MRSDEDIEQDVWEELAWNPDLEFDRHCRDGPEWNC